MEDPLSKLLPRLSLPSLFFLPRSELNRRSIRLWHRAGVGAGCRWPRQRWGWADSPGRRQCRLWATRRVCDRGAPTLLACLPARQTE
jgi:hypothetical protein